MKMFKYMYMLNTNALFVHLPLCGFLKDGADLFVAMKVHVANSRDALPKQVRHEFRSGTVERFL